jgi:hypothetical protein
MAIVKRSLTQIEAKGVCVNRKRMKATSEADIRHQMREDGDGPKAPMPAYALNLVKAAPGE